jgi:tetratricopeptide (TPR) repeat protein
MQKLIDAYLNNTMSKDERVAFEKQIEVDPTLKEDLSIYKTMQESFNENDWHVPNKDKHKDTLLEIKKEIKSEPMQHISQHIKNAELQYFEEVNTQKVKPKRFYTLAIAASIVLCISIGLPFLFANDSLEDHYNAYQDWDSIPSLTEKGAENIASKIETLFDAKDYKSIIKYYEQEVTKDTLHPYSLLKVGSAYFHNDNYNAALDTFDAFISLNTIDRSRGHWYKLLVYLKQEDTTKVKGMLDVILSNKANYNYKEALEIEADVK